MNRSGRAVALLCGNHEGAKDSLTVVHDDADVEFGRIRIRSGGGAGGHNGVRSLIEVLGHGDFTRVRLGVRGEGRDDGSLADYVLTDFLESERTTAVELAELGVMAIEYLVTHEVQQAMNRFNGVTVSSPDKQLGEDG
jgi:PTH1 family peptidyl-tRNA hydrolase